MAEFTRGRALHVVLCLALIAAAAALRLPDLSRHAPWLDEAVAAHNASGSFAETVALTRERNSSPILYPLVLWAVQKVDGSLAALRAVSAAASIFTVAAALLLLPRVGFPRAAAFFAALLAAVSAPAIAHARDAREYSLDALLAVLAMVGLFAWLRNGRKGLLCAALFIGPLVQYGLVLFGGAVLATAAIAASPGEAPASPGRRLVRRLAELRWPVAAFAAACAASYASTLRHQWQPGGFRGDGYLKGNYFGGDIGGVAEVAGFAASRIREFAEYHLSDAGPPLVLAALCAVPLAVLPGRFRGHPAPILFAASLTIAAAAAIARLYPMGGIRQSMYMAPVLFTAAGWGVHAAASFLPPFGRRAALAAAMAAAAVLGAHGIAENDPWRARSHLNAILDILDERKLPTDTVHVDERDISAMKILFESPPEGYHYGTCDRRITLVACALRLLDASPGAKRIWLVLADKTEHSPDFERLEAIAKGIRVETAFSDSDSKLYLIEGLDLLPGALHSYGSAPAFESSTFDVRLRGNKLRYFRDSCAPADTRARFALHITPVDPGDLPDDREQHGFDNLDFAFSEHGLRFAGKCVAFVPLPDYPIASIDTGQFTDGGHLWRMRIDDAGRRRSGEDRP